MPWNIERTAALFEKEILKSAAGLDDIKSAVVDSTTVNENPASSGRYVLEAGTVMAWTAGVGSKVMPVYNGDTVVQADVAGVLGHTVEFYIGQGVVAGTATDEPVPLLHHGCHFATGQLIGYTGNEADIKAALATCIFS